MVKKKFIIHCVIPLLVGNFLASIVAKYLMDGIIDWKFAALYSLTWSPIFSVVLWRNRKHIGF